MAEEGIGLVYGGGSVGLMGILADAVLDAGGKATGVIPGFLVTKELAHERLTKLIVTRSMHERKREMSRLADAFAILPG
ncbi:MAG: cytokinin riboside 5-monophosphate phosphoribohydrolase, partial [Deltaproteobacteria bacterium]|nr:cytokinin riboside 5-monophosphate phosphoribohydrolase [Deltaproteobacteria bacterium]